VGRYRLHAQNNDLELVVNLKVNSIINSKLMIMRRTLALFSSRQGRGAGRRLKRCCAGWGRGRAVAVFGYSYSYS
jgi:hypothetical protein